MKAGPFEEGYEQVYQLDGGILKYFEECGSAHYQGVFRFLISGWGGSQSGIIDDAVSKVSDAIGAGGTGRHRYVIGRSCPYCFQTSAQEMENRLRARERKLQELIHPLPGCVPYVNDRPLQVSQACRADCAGFLQQVLPHPEVSVLEEIPGVGRSAAERTFTPGSTRRYTLASGSFIVCLARLSLR